MSVGWTKSHRRRLTTAVCVREGAAPPGHAFEFFGGAVDSEVSLLLLLCVDPRAETNCRANRNL